MARHAWLWVVTAAAVASGCDHKVYEVDMAVEGNRITRSISVSIERHGNGPTYATAKSLNGPATKPAKQPASGPSAREAVAPSPAPRAAKPKNPSDLDIIAGIYKVGPAASQPWKARFIGRTPNDVGGAGEVACFKADMGSAWIYLERFRGGPDPASTLQAKLEAADTLASVIAGWAKARLGDREGFAKLGAYLDGDFHRDLKNLSLFTWTLGAVRTMRTAGEPEASKEPNAVTGNLPIFLSSAQLDVTAVALQYLIERKYLDVEDAPIITRVFGDSDVQKAALLKGLWRKFLTKKIGLTDKELVEHLVSIPDRSKEVQESLDAYVRECGEYKEYLARVRKHPPANGAPPVYNEPTVDGFIATLSGVAFTPAGMNLFNTDDELRLTLATGNAPVATNGTWSKKTGKILWRRRFRPAGSSVDGAATDPLPAVCYAAWDRPDEEFQKTHFGKAILHGRPLLTYCLWATA